ncbi:MAG: hypothetical protein JRK53_10090 [Deltaproteobacteria bacterium]|nr:hypothetical protein [Deltaproteobacteria bacterium]
MVNMAPAASQEKRRKTIRGFFLRQFVRDGVLFPAAFMLLALPATFAPADEEISR